MEESSPTILILALTENPSRQPSQMSDLQHCVLINVNFEATKFVVIYYRAIKKKSLNLNLI